MEPDVPDIREVFDPRAYLLHYYAAPSDEDLFALRFWADNVAALEDGASVLEFGGGPALYSVLALARKAGAIHFADYVPGALDEVRAWLARDPEAHDWHSYTRATLALEGSGATDAAVAAREERLRDALDHVTLCDAKAAEMVERPRPPYDAIAAPHCLDVTASDVDEFASMVRRLTALLVPGGLFLLAVTTGVTRYTVEEVAFPCLNLDRAQVAQAVLDAGVDRSRLAQVAAPVDGEEYTGILLTAGWKSA